MKLSRALGAAFAVSLSVVALSSHPAQAQPFTPGQCVTINGVPAKVIGPSPVQGLILAQSFAPYAVPNGYRPSDLKPAPCPGPKTVKAQCPPSDPDSNGRTPLEQQVRRAWRETQANTLHYTVHFNSVQLGQWSAWTAEQQRNLGDGDRNKPILPTQIDYVTCEDNGTYIETVRRIRLVVCYSSSVTGQMNCVGDSSVQGSDSTIQQLPKY
ncbi:MAG TPA: hypothetical protein VMM15_13700 [Bradyrhizobium sp.]|nr:hypothetical protein [Bradyrhizobium sp.]